ncbi:DUF5677 domain-containing protein [Halopseudomonas aestusnigri]|uniref:Uncharacterized protein n=1 Tax=Halopseudomonas aestusnigri TaxID=857252 RepID=A0AAQ1G4N8_9GAMM|nr:DUF5677 domain-containing protein [Halopseudomonas aestusnigri]SEF65901.1 hypothetical protein SAMN05216586_101608 [Halopseudomonas aestusnigri]
MPRLKEICENLSTHSKMLAQSSEDKWSDSSSPVDEPVRRILLRGSEIIRGAIDLGLTENPTALAILSRQLLELFISLHWVISDPERAERYAEFSTNELDRLAQMTMKDGLLSVKSKEDGTDVTNDFLSTRSKPRKGVSVEQQARESGILHLYKIFYRFMSLETHGKSETVVNPTERSEVTLVHLQTIGAISQVFGHTAILWLLHRQKITNEKIRELLGLNNEVA